MLEYAQTAEMIYMKPDGELSNLKLTFTSCQAGGEKLGFLLDNYKDAEGIFSNWKNESIFMPDVN